MIIILATASGVKFNEILPLRNALTIYTCRLGKIVFEMIKFLEIKILTECKISGTII